MVRMKLNYCVGVVTGILSTVAVFLTLTMYLQYPKMTVYVKHKNNNLSLTTSISRETTPSHSTVNNKINGQSVLSMPLSTMEHVAKEINRASTHARGIKTLKALQNVQTIIDELLKTTNLSFHKITKRKLYQPHSVCPEEFKGAKFGYPLYEHGFERTNCNYAKSLNQLLTVVTTAEFESNQQFQTYIQSLAKANFTKGHILFPTQKEDKISYGSEKTAFKIEFVTVNRTTTEGKIINEMVKKVKTQYTLIARNVDFFTMDARLDRLIGEIEMLNVAAVAGSFRNREAIWKAGCLQSVMRNYTLVYKEGYDESIHECMFCDHVDGPFLIGTETIKRLQFNENLEEGLFEDFFLRLGSEQSVVCPDSMFFVRNPSFTTNVQKWLPFAKIRNLYKIKSSNLQFVYPCKEYISQCTLQYTINNGLSHHPCCLEDLVNMTLTTMDFCGKAGIVCELTDGTLLTAVKMGKIAPWEKDSDIIYLKSNHSYFFNTTLPWFKAKKYRFYVTFTNRAFHVDSKIWNTQLWGFQVLGSSRVSPTKIHLNGKLVTTIVNPGLASRNLYGKEILQHASHWIQLGFKNGYQPYTEKKFIPCKKPGNPNCLDQFRTDGNLQFDDPIP